MAIFFLSHSDSTTSTNIWPANQTMSWKRSSSRKCLVFLVGSLLSVVIIQSSPEDLLQAQSRVEKLLHPNLTCIKNVTYNMDMITFQTLWISGGQCTWSPRWSLYDYRGYDGCPVEATGVVLLRGASTRASNLWCKHWLPRLAGVERRVAANFNRTGNPKISLCTMCGKDLGSLKEHHLGKNKTRNNLETY